MPTVLLVDDNPYVINFLSKCFTNEGFEVISAYNAKCAIELLIAENTPDINVVITDYEMPVINGLEFANTFKEIAKYKYVPIILYTQHSYMSCKDEKYKIFDLILIKPNMPQEIIKKAKELCESSKFKLQRSYTALKAKEKIYQTEVSKDLISTVTDGVIEEVNSWQTRLLDSDIPNIESVEIQKRIW